MGIFDNNSQSNQSKGLSLSDLPFNIFNGRSVDQSSWSWLNLLGQNPSVASATQQGVSYVSPKYNYLHNGWWLIDQVNEGALYTTGSGVTQFMDGFIGSATGSGVFKARRVVDPDNAALMCAEITCTTADTSIAATDFYRCLWRLEGSRVANLMSGTSYAKTVTIKFKFKSNVTGVYGISIFNNAANRFYPTFFTVTDTNENEYTLTIPLDTSGTWSYGNGVLGMVLRLTLAAGSNFQGAAGVWTATSIATTSAQCNFMSSTSNICYIKVIQMVEGTVAGDPMPQSYDEALRECQRYLPYLASTGTTNDFETGQAYSTSAVRFPWKLPVTPCTTPTTITVSNGSHFSAATATFTRNAGTGLSFINADNYSITLDLTGSSGLVAGNASTVSFNNASAFIYSDMRL